MLFHFFSQIPQADLPIEIPDWAAFQQIDPGAILQFQRLAQGENLQAATRYLQLYAAKAYNGRPAPEPRRKSTGAARVPTEAGRILESYIMRVIEEEPHTPEELLAYCREEFNLSPKTTIKEIENACRRLVSQQALKSQYAGEFEAFSIESNRKIKPGDRVIYLRGYPTEDYGEVLYYKQHGAYGSVPWVRFDRGDLIRPVALSQLTLAPTNAIQCLATLDIEFGYGLTNRQKRSCRVITPYRSVVVNSYKPNWRHLAIGVVRGEILARSFSKLNLETAAQNVKRTMDKLDYEGKARYYGYKLEPKYSHELAEAAG